MNTIPNDIKALKYKSSLSISNIHRTENKISASENLENLDKFLENEKNINSNEPWNKLDKTAKIKKFIIFCQKYGDENSLTELEQENLIIFLKDCLDRKKLQRIKDVNYDVETGDIINIPGLCFNKPSNHFTLKNLEKRVSTVRGLTPKKKSGTVKNKNTNKNDSDDEEEENEK